MWAEIRSDAPVLPITKKGGFGINQRLLLKMKPGDSIWDIPWTKVHSFRQTANRAGIKIAIRRIPDSKLYAIWRV